MTARDKTWLWKAEVTWSWGTAWVGQKEQLCLVLSPAGIRSSPGSLVAATPWHLVPQYTLRDSQRALWLHNCAGMAETRGSDQLWRSKRAWNRLSLCRVKEVNMGACPCRAPADLCLQKMQVKSPKRPNLLQHFTHSGTRDLVKGEKKTHSEEIEPIGPNPIQ